MFYFGFFLANDIHVFRDASIREDESHRRTWLQHHTESLGIQLGHPRANGLIPKFSPDIIFIKIFNIGLKECWMQTRMEKKKPLTELQKQLVAVHWLFQKL